MKILTNGRSGVLSQGISIHMALSLLLKYLTPCKTRKEFGVYSEADLYGMPLWTKIHFSVLYISLLRVNAMCMECHCGQKSNFKFYITMFKYIMCQCAHCACPFHYMYTTALTINCLS